MSNTRTLSILALVIPAAALAQSMPRGSFLLRPAKSIDGVIAQMDRQPGVARRYATHYGMSQSQVKRYFRSLRPTTIRQTGRYVVYGYHRDGITNDPQTIKRGEVVYKDSMGRFALRAVCGNPMTNGEQARQAIGEDLVARNQRVVPAPAVESAPAATATETVVTEETTSVQPIETPVAVAPTVETSTTVTAVETAPVAVAEPLPATTVIPQTSPTVPVTTSSNNNSILPILLGAGAVAGIALAASNSGGGEVVPEPASMLVLGTGVAAFVRRRRAKKD